MVYADAVVQARACAKLVREGSCTDPVIKAQRNALSAVFQLSMRLRVSPQARQVRKSIGSNTRAPSVGYTTASNWRWPPMRRISRVAREALERAYAMDPDRDPTTPPIDRKLDPEGWYRAAHSAAYACQCAALRPQPWQPVPANEYVLVTDDDRQYGPVMGRAAAAELLRRLLAAGLSRYEPDPVNALARVQAERARRAPQSNAV